MLREVVECFFPGAGDYKINPYGHGHINDTYRLDFIESQECFILQRINTNVFTDPSIIAETHRKVQEAIKSTGGGLNIPGLIPSAKGHPLCVDTEGKVWRMTVFISNSYTIEVVTDDWQAFEAGNAFGWFAKSCRSLDVADFSEPIRDFHRLSFRLRQLNEAITRNQAGHLDSVTELVNFFRARESRLCKIEELVDSGEIPLRIVHNDTKINNLLFSDQKATTVIDLDTVGPGILYYDYGDALRTTASTAAEDEKHLSRVDFDINRYAAFTRGYLGQTREMLCQVEKEHMHLAPVLMTYIMGIRFLADHLNGGVYYKTSYPEQNADRSRVQKKLIESMERLETRMKSILKAEFKKKLNSNNPLNQPIGESRDF